MATHHLTPRPSGKLDLHEPELEMC
ncbi:hypothetical protein OOU_Y34scaffold00119g1 [Pyricularia oryzae Y34]|uniref:Uncharacterized protein n=1 Tax=Pyricularia oryzae (strain Y34) TaxID=1143189 RepID=A0AA97P8D9_PYRO3|nr:hypothetical protein OOU_Y34scaffold00119g1 [Pyricularia oryzae Y34]